MKNYIGCKLIKAEPCKAWKNTENNKIGEDGYKVIYPDGYVSWSPKEVFEKAYMEIGDNNSITQENVDKFIAKTEVVPINNNKTTVVLATLANGFIIVEGSSCVDEDNYDEKIGVECCVERIKNKVWEFLGFLLQTATNGVKPKD